MAKTMARTGKDWKILNKLEARTVADYRDTVASLGKTLQGYFDKYAIDGRLSMQEMAKFDRAKKMLSEMDGTLDELIKKRSNGLWSALGKSFKDSFKAMARKVEKMAGDILGMKVPDPMPTIDNGGLLTTTEKVNTAKTRAELKRAIITGLNSSSTAGDVLINGLPYREFLTNIKGMMDADKNRFVRVLQAEGTRVNQAAKNFVWNEIQTPGLYRKQMTLFEVPSTDKTVDLIGGDGKAQTVKLYGGTNVQLGDMMEKVWRHDGPKNPRETHVAADGQVADENGMFHVSGYTVDAPGNFGDPAEDCNCLCYIDIQMKKVSK